MTTADAIFLAKDALPIAEKNPFTGKIMAQDKSGGVNVWLDDGSLNANESAFFLPTKSGFHVSPTDISVGSNWRKIRE